MEITARIHSIPAPEAFYTGPQAPNVFLVTDGGEGALIDSGFGDEQSLRARLEYLRERPDVYGAVPCPSIQKKQKYRRGRA